MPGVAEEAGLTHRFPRTTGLSHSQRTVYAALAGFGFGLILWVYSLCRWHDLHRGVSSMFDRITFDHEIMDGRACIRGMRIPVSVIVRQIAYGATVDEILAGYPDLEPDDVQQAIQYAAWLTEEEVHTA
jgi:uncharacterized protein (DUF433 family)